MLLGIVSQKFTTAIAKASVRAFSCSDLSDMLRHRARLVPEREHKKYSQRASARERVGETCRVPPTQPAQFLNLPIYQSANLPILISASFHRHPHRFLLRHLPLPSRILRVHLERPCA